MITQNPFIEWQYDAVTVAAIYVVFAQLSLRPGTDLLLTMQLLMQYGKACAELIIN